MYFYKFQQGSQTPCSISVGLPKDGYISFGDGSPVDWKKFAYDGSGGLTAIPKPEPPSPYVPTADELKQQKINALNAEYTPRFSQLDNDAIAAKVLYDDTDTFNAVIAEKTTLTKEYLAKLEAIKNG